MYRTRFECGSYPKGPSPVPNTFRSAVRTPEALLLYRTRFGVRFVPQRPISCTEHVSECGSYPRGSSPVPNTFRSAVCTPGSISCTEYVSKCGSYPRGPSPVPNTFRSAVCTPEALLLYRTRFGVRFVPQRPISCTELCWESFRASESLILCRVHHNKCTMWLLAYGKMALLMSIRVAEKQKSESGAI